MEQLGLAATSILPRQKLSANIRSQLDHFLRRGTHLSGKHASLGSPPLWGDDNLQLRCNPIRRVKPLSVIHIATRRALSFGRHRANAPNTRYVGAHRVARSKLH